MSAEVAKRPLRGAKLGLERLERTDSILVEHLHQSTKDEILTLYFESDRSGGGEVTGVQMLTKSIARVSFKDFETVERVLTKSHKLGGSDLSVKPYFSVFVPEDCNVPAHTTDNGTTRPVSMEIDPPVVSATTATIPNTSAAQFKPQTVPTKNASDTPHPTKPAPDRRPLEEATGVQAKDTMEVESVATPVVLAAAAPAAAATSTTVRSAMPVTCNIAVTDPVKLSLLELSGRLQEFESTHAGFTLSINQNGVSMSGPDQQGLAKLKNSVLMFLGDIAQSTLPLAQEEVEFLAREDVKAKLTQSLKASGLLFTYTVVDGRILLTSLSVAMADQVCKSIKSLVHKVTLPVEAKYESNLYCQEWPTFLQTLSLCSAGLTHGGTNITVVTLKGIEEEAQSKIIQFLSTPIQKEVVISMEPGKLKYLQIYQEQLLADLTMVTLFPLETGNGLSITGDAAACQMAEEILRDVVDCVCTKTITLRHPGVARFLIEHDGAGILEMLQTKFQVYISMEKVHWEPVEDEDIFKAGWKIISQQNFSRNSQASSASSTPAGLVADQSMEKIGIEEAKQLLCAIGAHSPDKAHTTSQEEPVEEDLKSGGNSLLNDRAGLEAEPANDSQPRPLTEAGPLRVESEDAELNLAKQMSLESMDSSSLDEMAQMSFAIQRSLEINRKSTISDDKEDEDELQRVLERSMMEFSAAGAAEGAQLRQAMVASLQDTIQAANVAEIFVFAYSDDLICIPIALEKKVGMRQYEEKVQHRNLRSRTAHHQRCLDYIRRKHAVDIRVEGTTAIISGFKEYVSEAVPTLRDFVIQMSSVTSDAEILKTVQWAYHSQGTATSYPPEAIVYLENAWKNRQKSIDILIDHQPHLIDFEKMKEINKASGKSLAIQRKLLNLVDIGMNVPAEEMSLLSSLPDAHHVDENSDEFHDVVKEFYDSIQEYHNKIKIVKVEKLMNSLLVSQYKLKKASMQQHCTHPQVERTLFHGTSETSVKEICIHGFNRSFCGKNATVYGQGVYFAVNSGLSISDTYSPPNTDGHKFVFMAKVLTGDHTIGKHEMKTAPLKENQEMPLRYDSVTDQMKSPTLFVIFNDTQAYPEYLITCQKIYR